MPAFDLAHTLGLFTRKVDDIRAPLTARAAAWLVMLSAEISVARAVRPGLREVLPARRALSEVPLERTHRRLLYFGEHRSAWNHWYGDSVSLP